VTYFPAADHDMYGELQIYNVPKQYFPREENDYDDEGIVQRYNVPKQYLSFSNNEEFLTVLQQMLVPDEEKEINPNAITYQPTNLNRVTFAAGNPEDAFSIDMSYNMKLLTGF
jgi:hypothetical protein